MSKYIAVYNKLCPDDVVEHYDWRRRQIMSEIRAIHRAKTDADAAAVIAWWDCWPNPYFKTPLSFVRAVRRELGK